MKIALGTVSNQKVVYLKELLDELTIDAEIIPLEADSLVSFQPMTSDETKLGSINRARGALRLVSDADYGIGIEVGYDLNSDGRYEIFCWTTMIAATGHVVSNVSESLALPDFHTNILRDGLNLGDHVRVFLDDNPDEESQKLGEIIRNRKAFIVGALKSCLVDLT